MGTEDAEQLADFLQEETLANLRSVIYYDAGSYELIYAHEDLDERYTEDDIDDIINELGVQSLERSIKESAYHNGDLQCSVKWFEDGIELYIFLGETEGIAVGFGSMTFIESRSFLWRCLDAAGVDINGSDGR